MPPELRNYIVQNNLGPTPAAVAHLAQLLGASVTGAEGNRLAWPDGEVKVVWHMIEQDHTTTWGWDPVSAGGGEDGVSYVQGYPVEETTDESGLFPAPPFEFVFLNGVQRTIFGVEWIEGLPFFLWSDNRTWSDINGDPL